ncbi:hypothetical protein BaRGS_00030455, partial [Batillaria attramentaria]
MPIARRLKRQTSRGQTTFRTHNPQCSWCVLFDWVVDARRLLVVLGDSGYQRNDQDIGELYDKINTRSQSPAHRPSSDAVHQAKDVRFNFAASAVGMSRGELVLLVLRTSPTVAETTHD